MNDSLDKQLRAALQPIDPGDDFTQRVLSRIGNEGAAARSSARLNVTQSRKHSYWMYGVLAASISAVGVVALVVHQRNEREAGELARQQVLEALQVTSEKLNLAYRVVRDRSERNAEDNGV
jgi:hypothetical protein